jgi:hypothetical protein
MHRRLLLLVLFVLPLAFAAPAQAIAPTRVVTTQIDLTYVDTDLCGFPITFVENGTYKATTYYNSQGTPLRSVITNQRRYVATATANGKTLLTNYPLVIRTTFESNTRTEMGLLSAYHVPGKGLILINTGRLVIDRATGNVVFSAGPHNIVEGNVSDFCGYFAGP